MQSPASAWQAGWPDALTPLAQVEHSKHYEWNKHYFKGSKPMGVFSYGLHEEPAASWLHSERLNLISAWLSAQPGDRALPRSAVKAIDDQSR